MLAGIMFALVGSLAAAPAAHAQIVPASLTHEAVADSKIPSSVTLLPLPRIEPRKPVADTYERLFFVMSAGVYAAAGLDMQDDPLGQAARRFAHAGVVRRRSVVCHGRELAGLENGAVAALAQNLLGAASHFDRRKPGRILLYPCAQDNELARSPRCSTVQ